MAKPSKDQIVKALLERHGRTYAADLGLDLERNTPSVLYRWLCAATLLSARIGANAAIQAARALAERGWTTAQKMADASWEQRTRALNQAGYARYDESTSRMFPFADRRALEAAKRLGLDDDAGKLAKRVSARTTRSCSPPWSAHVLPRTSMRCWRRQAVEA